MVNYLKAYNCRLNCQHSSDLDDGQSRFSLIRRTTIKAPDGERVCSPSVIFIHGLSTSFANHWCESVQKEQNKKNALSPPEYCLQSLSPDKISKGIYTWSLTECQGWPFNLYGYWEQISSTANGKDQISASANRLGSERWLVCTYILATRTNWNLSVNVKSICRRRILRWDWRRKRIARLF